MMAVKPHPAVDVWMTWDNSFVTIKHNSKATSNESWRFKV